MAVCGTAGIPTQAVWLGNASSSFSSMSNYVILYSQHKGWAEKQDLNSAELDQAEAAKSEESKDTGFLQVSGGRKYIGMYLALVGIIPDRTKFVI